MPQSEVFKRLDRLFTSRIQQSVHVRRWRSDEVRSIDLIGGVRLECAMDEERAYWYEMVFPDGGRTHVDPGSAVSAIDAQTLGFVFHENNA